MKRIVSGIMLAVLLTSMLTLAFNVQPVKANGTIYIRADGSVEGTTYIQTADNVTYVFTADIINDSIVVERNNIIIDGKGYTLRGGGIGRGIDLSGRTNVTVHNATIKAFDYGIWLSHSSSNTISGNNITNNWHGIDLYYSSNNTLAGNIMTNNVRNIGVWASALSDFVNYVDTSNTVDGKPVYYWVNRQDMTVPLDAGIVVLANCTRMTVQNLNLARDESGVLLAYTTNSTITQNNIANNDYGIRLDYSSSNTVSGNNIANNDYGIRLDYSSSNTVSGNNIANNDYGIRLDYSSNNSIVGNNIRNNGWGVALYGSSNNSISGNNIANNDDGIGLDYDSSNNSISGNNITANNQDGIVLGYSSNNSISGNNIANNQDGIWLGYSSNNIIYHNNFINNVHQIYKLWGWQVWDDGYPSGGNYWSDYVGVDVRNGPDQNLHGSDGIGDTPYIIDADNVDHYPLMNPYGAPPPPTHTLTITVTVGGTTDPAPGTYSYTVNSTVHVTAIPDANYLFDHWELDGVNVGSINPTIVTMNTDRTLYTVFIEHHDVAVTNVTPYKTVIGQGYSLNINVTAANQGDYEETFNITLYANTTAIATQTITLTSGNSTTITFTWNTSGFAKGNYTISAYASPVSNETDTADNTFTDGWVIVAMVGDITGPDGWPDGKVDMISDIRAVVKVFGVVYPNPRYNPNCDINGDGVIDLINDIRTVAKHFGDIDP